MLGQFAIVSVNNPPVNALGQSVRAALSTTLGELDADEAVAGIILTCAGRTFFAGADIAEFGLPALAPSLRDLLAQIENSAKPVLAAMHGTPLGGGLELAMACHLRLATLDTKMGLPEVKLGLIPGAGGTVRLPYLIGPEAALRMIVQGTTMDADEALEAGLIDGIVSSGAGFLSEAVTFIQTRLLAPTRIVPVRGRRQKIEQADRSAFETAAIALATRSKGSEAIAAAIGAVRNALFLSFEEALATERAAFDALVASEQSAAQRHIFFAERAARKAGSGVAPALRTEIRSVGVVGAGTMGGGIAMAFANAGFPVVLAEVNAEALERGHANIARNYATSVSRGSLSAEEAQRRLALIQGAPNLASLAHCDLIVEAVFEDMAIKKAVFAQLDGIARPDAILTTNTSYLDVNEIATATTRPANVLGLHFFSPANVMKLVEVVRADKTDPAILAAISELARRLDKVPVVVGVCHGFVGNRMLEARSAGMMDLLLEGATPEQVDRAFTDFGWPMGPFQMQDLAGLDISWRKRKSRGESLIIADDLCERGRLGQKTGKGYYRYEDGSRKPLSDDVVLDLIASASQARNIVRREISAEEIIERTHYPMINEGHRILGEAIVPRSSDIDIVWVYGYGFPQYKGGPMFWAERQGLDHVVARLEHWRAVTGQPAYLPSAELVQAAGLAEAERRPDKAVAQVHS
ncbi:MAG: enoyl-CoA hydratase/isomerase family protein [Devosia sp.]|nr:enoyl-CoA hydratase/isomerase family protein [Devosia sp.]